MFEVPRAAAATVMVFGAMGLVGSLLDIGVLERIGAGWATMDASTGLALLLAGGALWGLADEKAPAAARRTSQVLALLVGVIGVLSLMVYAYRWPSLAAYLDPGYLAGGRGSGGGHRAEPRPRLAGAAPGEHGDARAPPAPLRVPGRGDGRHHRARHHGHPVWAPSLVNSLVLFVYVGLVVGTAIVLHREDIARQKTEQRLMAQEAAARALTEVETLDAATQRVLSAIAEHLGWDVGLYWRVDRERNVLHLAHLWHSGQLNVAPFEAQVRNLSFRPGMGLPGRVWMTGQPVWNADMQRFPSFRAWGALESGLHASFGFPVRVGAEVVGVLEFISRSPREPDRALLDTLPVLGSQLGESMERKAAEERLRDSEERLRLLLQGVKDHAIFMLDADGRVSSWNDEAERITGYTRADILGEGLAVLYTPEDREAGLPEQALRRGGYEPVFARVDSGPAMRADLEQEQWDIIISDHKMPGFSGLEALALVRQRGSTSRSSSCPAPSARRRPCWP